LESLGFEWKPSLSRRKETPKKPSLDDDDDATYPRERAVEPPENRQLHSVKKIATIEKSAAIKSTPLSNPNTGMAKSTSTSPPVEPIELRSEKAGEVRFDETDLEGSPSELATKQSLYSDSQATKSLTLDKSAPADDIVESNTGKDALQAEVPRPAHLRFTKASAWSRIPVASSRFSKTM
jgi:hypothetical protein